MFRLPAQITKSEKVGNILKIEGLATEPLIDKDSERMDESAIRKMADAVNKGNIPIRVEHEDKFYSEIGVWKTATIDKDGKMFVAGEIDLELSLGKDVEILMKRGKDLGLSIGGKVLDAALEYAADIGKSIRLYKDILLEEITITKKPAVASSFLTVAKSFDAEVHSETTEAVSLEESLQKREAVNPEEFKEKVHNDNLFKALVDANEALVQKKIQQDSEMATAARKQLSNKHERPVTDMPMSKSKQVGKEGTKAPSQARNAENANESEKAIRKSFTEAFEEVDELIKTSEVPVEKEAYEELYKDCCYDHCGEVMYTCFCKEDIQLITAIAKVISEVDDLENIEKPEKLQDWEFVDSLPAESFVIEMESRMFPHHNADFTLNLEWVQFWLAQLINGNYPWLTPKEFKSALCHLYHHYKMAKLGTAKKSSDKKVEKAHVQTQFESDIPDFSQADIDLMHECYKFVQGMSTTRPQIEGNDVSDKVAKKMAEGYAAMMQTKARRQSLGSRMADTYRTAINPRQPDASDGTSVVNKSTSSPDNDMSKKKDIAKTEGEADETATPSEETTPAEEAASDTEVEKTEGESVEKACSCGKSSCKSCAKSVTKSEDDGEADETPADDTEAGEESGEVEKGMKDKKKKEVMKKEETQKSETKPVEGKSDVSEDVEKSTEEEDATPSETGSETESSDEEASKSESGESDEEVAKSEDKEVSPEEVKKKTEEGEATEETPEEAPAEEGETTEKSKTEKVADEVTKTANEASMREIAKQVFEEMVAPAIDKLTKTVESLGSQLNESVQKSEKARTEELNDVRKDITALTGTLETQSKALETISKRSVGRKSVANQYTTVEKKFSRDDTSDDADTLEERVTKFYEDKANAKIPVHEAYATVRKAMLAEESNLVQK